MNRKIVDYDIIIGRIYGPKEKRFEGIMMKAIKNGFVPHGDIHILSDEERLLQAVIKYEEKEEKEDTEVCSEKEISKEEQTLDSIYNSKLKVLQHLQNKYIIIGNQNNDIIGLLINNEAIPDFIETRTPQCGHKPPYEDAERCTCCSRLQELFKRYKKYPFKSHLVIVDSVGILDSFEEEMYTAFTSYKTLLLQLAMVDPNNIFTLDSDG